MERSPGPRILREDDPAHDELIARGWTVAHWSWGARLALGDDADLAPLRAAVRAAEGAGYAVRRLAPQDVPALEALDAQVAPDFPDTPASHHEPPPADLVEGLREGRSLGFIAVVAQAGAEAGDGAGAGAGGSLVAYTWMNRLPDRWEVERTAVAGAHRRRGLARAVKAACVLATHAEGARLWGTGGAGVNAGSLAMNRSLGFELEPLWHTLVPPGAGPLSPAGRGRPLSGARCGPSGQSSPWGGQGPPSSLNG